MKNSIHNRKTMYYFFMLNIIMLSSLSGCCISDTQKSQIKPPENVEILAHRGYSEKYPESTFIAFEQALKSGFTGLEFDIHQTKDSQLIIMHDSKVDRTTNGKGMIKDLSLEQIKSLRVNPDQEIPTLDEVINLAKRNNNIPIWIEIKDSDLYPNIINNIYAKIKEHGYEHNTIIQSFNIDDLESFHKLSSKTKLLKLYDIRYDFTKLPDYITYVGIPLIMGKINTSIIKETHDHNLKIIFWRESGFFETENSINCLIDKGADGFMINKPFNNNY